VVDDRPDQLQLADDGRSPIWNVGDIECRKPVKPEATNSIGFVAVHPPASSIVWKEDRSSRNSIRDANPRAAVDSILSHNAKPTQSGDSYFDCRDSR
jgi:hypothetical protein